MAVLLAVAIASTSSARGPKAARDADFQMAVTQAHKRYKADRSGTVPEAGAGVSADLYGVVIVRINGTLFEAGDTRVPFALAAVANPFTAALVAEQSGSTGSNNPLEREGSIAILGSLKPPGDPDARWRALLGNFGAFAGNELFLDESLYRSTRDAVGKVEEEVRVLAQQGRLQDDSDSTADLYVRQGAVVLTTRDLAIMAATLANGGRNPMNGRVVVRSEVSQNLQAQIAKSGLMNLGMPAVGGQTGAIFAVIPGRFGLAVYSPPLDAAGQSVRGQRAIRYLSRALMTNLEQF
jgi:glutaminase